MNEGLWVDFCDGDVGCCCYPYWLIETDFYDVSNDDIVVFAHVPSYRISVSMHSVIIFK